MRDEEGRQQKVFLLRGHPLTVHSIICEAHSRLPLGDHAVTGGGGVAELADCAMSG